MNMNMRWDLNPKDFMPEVENSLKKMTNELAEAVFDGVVERSPVDTGSFRASWTIGVNEPDMSEVTGGASGSPLGAPTYKRPNFSKFDQIHIFNGKKYAYSLEHGHSGQAPLGIVEVTIASLRPR